MAETVNTNKKSKVTQTATSASNKTEAADVNELRNQLNASMDMIKQMQDVINQLKSERVASVVQTVPHYADVTLVYTSTSLGYISVPGAGLSLNCTRYGETFVLSRPQLDALIGKYRRWFDDGILALSDNDVRVAAEKGVKTVGELALDSEKLESLGDMSNVELEKLWNSLKLHSQRESLVLYYKRKFIENKESGYRDRSRIDLLNRLTDNGFAREAAEVSGVNVKLQPKNLLD